MKVATETRQNKLLQIAELGSPVIRQKSAIIKKIKDQDIQNLIDDMIATVKEVNGVGIAAPQVYKSLRLFILASHPNPRYPNAPLMNPLAVINPIIISHSDEKEKDWSGCLSIPGLRCFTPRYKSIYVKFYTRNGRLIQKKFNDFVARIFQHEYDHLEGSVIIDKVETTVDMITEKEYQKLLLIKLSK